MANPLVEVQKLGQSIWYDNIRRGLITSGELQSMIDHDGLLGVTSNPAIFSAAITGSHDYDQATKALISQGMTKPIDIYEKLAIDDIQWAADVLHPTYERTNRVDGYISMEVSPYLANDTKASIEEARRLRKAVGRDNVLIKVPATPAGVPAIQTLISEGISINVTLLFAVEAYEAVANAYMTGLEQLAAKGGDITKVASVASFFVSRIDTLVDSKLDKLIEGTTDAARKTKLQSLHGKIAIANAKVAYESYKKLHATDRWKALAAKKAMPQRLLWASTGTKNPKYSKTLYVDGLIGADTVNTVPGETFQAFKETGTVRPTLTENWGDNIGTAHATMKALADVGISMKEVTETLLTDAVKKFCDPFDTLLAAIDKKRQALQPGK